VCAGCAADSGFLPRTTEVVSELDRLAESTLILWFCHTVPPHQQVPSNRSAAITVRVGSGLPKETSTWFRTTSFSASNPAKRASMLPLYWNPGDYSEKSPSI
jgi:hypothetical protein